MFNLDLKLFNILYTQCKMLGQVFGFGPFEGFVMYLSVVILAVVKVLESKRKVKK